MIDVTLGRLGYAERGLFSDLASYAPRDVVTFQGSTYRCLTAAAAGESPASHPEKWLVTARGTLSAYARKGDLLTFDGSDVQSVPVGKSGQLLGVRDDLPVWLSSPSRVGAGVRKLAYNPLGSSVSYGALPVIMTDGSVKMWGASTVLSAGDYGNNHLANPQTVAFDPVNPPVLPLEQVASCYHSSYALDSAGRVYAWGGNAYGQLGQGDSVNRAVATQINWFVQQGISIAEIVVSREGGNSVSAGAVFFRTTDGRVYGCGYNAYGQLGNGTTANSSVPVRCGTITGITKLYASAQDMCSVYAVDETGRLYVWGYNGTGQLGLGDTVTRLAPTLVPNITKVVKVACTAGNYSSTYVGDAVVLTSDGGLYVCGWNGQGALGLGDTTMRPAFVKLETAAFTPADVELFGGYYDSLWIVDTKGRLWACGYNGYGQLGLGDTVNRTVPVQVLGQSFDGKVVRVKAGGGQCGANSYVFAVMQDSDGRLWGAGYNGYGQLGVGDASSRSRFTPLAGAGGTATMGIVDYTTGGYSSSGRLWVLTADGRVWAAGENSNYSLGNQSGNPHLEARLCEVLF